MADLQTPLYVSLDLDVLEPMLAPGISHPEPGGLSVRDVLDVLAKHDVRDLTARVAAKFAKELTALCSRP